MTIPSCPELKVTEGQQTAWDPAVIEPRDLYNLLEFLLVHQTFSVFVGLTVPVGHYLLECYEV